MGAFVVQLRMMHEPIACVGNGVSPSQARKVYPKTLTI